METNPTIVSLRPAASGGSLARWRCLLPYLRPYRGRIALATVALLVQTAALLACPLLVVCVLDIALHAQDVAALDQAGALLLAVFTIEAAASFLRSYLLTYIAERVVYDLRTDLYRHLQALSMDFHSTSPAGDLASRLSSDVTQLRTMLTTSLDTIVRESLLLVGAVVVLVKLNALYSVFILALVAVTVLTTYSLGNRIHCESQRIQDFLASAMAVVEQGLHGVYAVKSFGRESHEVERYRGAMHRSFRASLRMAFSTSLLGSAMGFLSWGFVGGVMWFGGREVIAGRLTVSMITGFLFYGLTIASAVRLLGEAFGQASAALGGMRRVFELLDTPPTVQDVPGAASLPACAGHIAFESVSFGYSASAPVLEGITLQVPAGQILALVGPSGAGKSTLCHLIPRFYDPTAGTVRVDGHDLRSLAQGALRAHIGVVPQDPTLLDGTIRENLLYGKLDATEDELIAAARAANAHDFIVSCPGGYDARVGPRGTNLSGGQRQRIAIARAILKDPRILLLDEPTSALDNESERLVQEALHRLMQGRTTLIIAHRLSTIRMAHRIAVLDQGRLAELGTHPDLLMAGGLYARLHATQFQPAEAGATPPDVLPFTAQPLNA
jgi:ATP-binding cassette, subfamily B, bacterial MsbA